MTAALPLGDRSALAAAVERAAREAGSVGGAFLGAACRFVPLPEGAAALLPPRGPGAWVLVAVEGSPEPDHAAHLRERARTAAQRFTLSLWAEGVDAVWLADGLPAPEALDAAGLALAGTEALGLVWLPGT